MKSKHLIIYISLAVIAFVLAALLLLRCDGSNKEEQKEDVPFDTIPNMVRQIQSCSRLNTAEVKVHKIVTHDDEMRLNGKILGKEVSIGIPVGKRKVAIPLYATLKSSIDLTQVTKDDIVRHNNKIEVFLPSPETVITETHIDHEGIRQYIALTRSRFSDQELQNYERQGRDAIEKDIPNLGIEQMAKESAARQLIPIIQAMGYEEKDITITFRKDVKNNGLLRQNR